MRADRFRHVTPEVRLHELGIELPKQLPVLGSYRVAKRHRGIVYIDDHVSLRLDHSDLVRGKVGADLTLEEACEAARICALHMVSTLRIETGSLDQVASILKVFGMVNIARIRATGEGDVRLHRPARPGVRQDAGTPA